MKDDDFKSMSVDDLWRLYEQVNSELVLQIAVKKETLERRLRLLTSQSYIEYPTHARRAYPPVFPKFRNPAHPDETWAGRGKQPRWLTAQLRSGKALDEFRI